MYDHTYPSPKGSKEKDKSKYVFTKKSGEFAQRFENKESDILVEEREMGLSPWD